MVSRLNHMRVLALMLLLLLLDLSFLFVTCSLSLERGPSILLLFAFEVRHCTHAMTCTPTADQPQHSNCGYSLFE